VLLNYYIGRFVLCSLCVGDLVRLGLSSVRVAGCFSLQHGHTIFAALQWGKTMVLGVDSASNRNEYQDNFLEVKAAGA